jgi:hypothetical protein
MWLPVPLPVPGEPVPTDVLLWLCELRHYSDSNDVPCNSKVNVDCDSAAADGNELYAEAFQHLGLKKSDEKIRKCEVVQEYRSTAEVSAPKEDIPRLLTQKAGHCVKIHSQEEEIQNYHSVGQEYRDDSTPGLLIQKEDVCVESHRKDEGTLNCHYGYPKNAISIEEISGLPIWKEEVCVDDYWKVEEETLICCECCKNFTPREDFPTLQQKEENNVRSHKCDCDDVSGIKVYSCVIQGNGILNTDKSSIQGDNQAVSQYQVGELPSYNNVLTCNSILWETNPLYRGVGEGRSGKGFRKLCHSMLKQLGESIHVGPVEEFGLISSQIREPPSAKVTEGRGVACALQTDCSVCGQERLSGNCPLKFHSECDSFREETCQCGLDLSAFTHLTDDRVNQTTSSVTDVTDFEIYGQTAVQNHKHHQTILCDVCDRLVTGIVSSASHCGNAVDCSPTPQFQNPTSQYFIADNAVTVPFGEKCEEVLQDLELIIQNLERPTGDVPADHEMVSDVDFLKLCQEAQNLAEETDQQCSVQIISKVKKPRSSTLNSDLSDDVFIDSPFSEEYNELRPLPKEVHRHHSLDINSIFDDGTKPPVPPARTKRRREKSKTICGTEGRIIDESKNSAAALECDTSSKSASQLVETELSVREAGCENSLLDCQELLIMKRVTESTKEKRSAKVTSHYEDRNLFHQGCQTHQCVSNSMNVTVVSDDFPDPLMNGKGAESFTPGDCMIRKSGDEGTGFLNVVLTQTRPISSTEFPPSQQVHSFSSSCDIRPQSEVETVKTSCDESGILLQNRKGSTSSDITAWKQELQHSGFYYLDDEWDAECMLQPDKVHVQFCELS